MKWIKIIKDFFINLIYNKEKPKQLRDYILNNNNSVESRPKHLLGLYVIDREELDGIPYISDCLKHTVDELYVNENYMYNIIDIFDGSILMNTDRRNYTWELFYPNKINPRQSKRLDNTVRFELHSYKYEFFTIHRIDITNNPNNFLLTEPVVNPHRVFWNKKVIIDVHNIKAVNHRIFSIYNYIHYSKRKFGVNSNNSDPISMYDIVISPSATITGNIISNTIIEYDVKSILEFIYEQYDNISNGKNPENKLEEIRKQLG